MSFRSRRVMDRIRRRMPCELFVRDHWHSGLVLDLSARGFFVQTNAKPNPRERFELRLTCDGSEALDLLVEVARLRKAPPTLVSAVHGGTGVRIVIAPEEYYQFLSRIAAPERQELLDFADEPGEAARFQVRVREIGGPRSKRIEVSASDGEAARDCALAECGDGWKVLDVAEVRTPSPHRASGEER
jgi:PilZ domain-containing protein